MEINLIAGQTIEHFVSAKTATKAKKINQDFIQLVDGTLRILTEDWVKKFRALFQLGNVKNEDEL